MLSIYPQFDKIRQKEREDKFSIAHNIDIEIALKLNLSQ